MQRTLNYTGRKRIEQKEALFSFGNDNNDVPEFNVEFKLASVDYPQDASLYVEAYYKETRQRFSFGRVSAIKPPTDRRLNQIDLSGPPQFRVTIVGGSNKHCLILASGEGFRADADDKPDDNRSSILNVKTWDLGQKTWEISFETDGMPELLLNKKIHNPIERMRSDPMFQALILPAALKQVLTWYLWNSGEESEGRAYWMAFAGLFGEKKRDDDDPVEMAQWIDTVVDGFATKFGLCDKLINSTGEGDE